MQRDRHQVQSLAYGPGWSETNNICIHATINGNLQDCITRKHFTCQATVNYKEIVDRVRLEWQVVMLF